MKIGDVDVLNSILKNEVDIRVLQDVLDFIIQKNGFSIQVPTQFEIDAFREKAIKEIKVKYPHLGIKATPNR